MPQKILTFFLKLPLSWSWTMRMMISVVTCWWWVVGWWIGKEGNRGRQAWWEGGSSKKGESRCGPKWDSGASHLTISPPAAGISQSQASKPSHIQTPIILAQGGIHPKPSCKLSVICLATICEQQARNTSAFFLQVSGTLNFIWKT